VDINVAKKVAWYKLIKLKASQIVITIPEGGLLC